MKTNIRAEMTAILRNVMRQPTYSPTTRPMGRPTTIATDEPVAIVLSPSVLRPSGTVRTASGGAIDQNIEWAHATPMRESISV